MQWYLLTSSKLYLATKHLFKCTSWSCEFKICFKSVQFYKFGSTIHNNYYTDMKMNTLTICDITEKFNKLDQHSFCHALFYAGSPTFSQSCSKSRNWKHWSSLSFLWCQSCRRCCWDVQMASKFCSICGTDAWRSGLATTELASLSRPE